MNTLVILAVLIAGSYAQTYSRNPSPHNGGSGYGGNSGYGGGSGYGSSGGHAGSGGYHGGNRGGYAPRSQYYYPPPIPVDQPSTELDQLKSRLSSVLEQLKLAQEIYDSLAARLSLQRKFVNDLLYVKFAALRETDQSQNTILGQLEGKVTDLRSEIYDKLKYNIEALQQLNDDNIDALETANDLYGSERTRDIKQGREIAELNALVRGLKDKLFQVKDNAVERLIDDIEDEEADLASVRRQARRQMCEFGQTTLTPDAPRVELSYQSNFGGVPTVFAAVSGFNIQIDQSKNQGYGYGYGYQQPEPHSIGFRTVSYSTDDVLSIALLDTSFGESSVASVDVAYTACLIGPNQG